MRLALSNRILREIPCIGAITSTANLALESFSETSIRALLAGGVAEQDVGPLFIRTFVAKEFKDIHLQSTNFAFGNPAAIPPAVLFQFAGELDPGVALRASDMIARFATRAPNNERKIGRILIQNSHRAITSGHLWSLAEATEGRVRIAWSNHGTMLSDETASIALPRLIRFIDGVSLLDWVGPPDEPTWRPLGESAAEIRHIINLLRGLGFDGWICVEPPAQVENVEKFIRQSIEFVAAEWQKPTQILPAYRGDHRAVHYSKTQTN